MKKKIYNIPYTEIIAVSSFGICQSVSKFGSFNNGGGTADIDPGTGGL